MIGIRVGLGLRSDGQSAPSTHTITISSSDGRGLAEGCFWSPASPVSVNHGSNQNVELTAIEQEGWYIESLLMDGVSVPEATSMPYFNWTFINVVADHTVVVTFGNGM